MRKRILDIEDVARMKKVHPGTVYHWVEKSLLVPIRIGRSLFFSLKDVQNWSPPKGQNSKSILTAYYKEEVRKTWQSLSVKGE